MAFTDYTHTHTPTKYIFIIIITIDGHVNVIKKKFLNHITTSYVCADDGKSLTRAHL